MKKTARYVLKKGFTMVELLIVIAVLGILAVAVLSAINPIEQMNRSRDTGNRSDAEQLISAIDRYYTTKGYYPWQVGATSTRDINRWVNIKDPLNFSDDGGNYVLNNLSGETAELKKAFIDRIARQDYNTLYIFNRGTLGDSTYVCFQPKSSAFNKEGDDRCAVGMPGDVPLNINGEQICRTGGNYDRVCLP